MSAETDTGLARFDTRTRPRRAAHDDAQSEQIDLRALGARERGQLALGDIDATRGNSTLDSASRTVARANGRPDRADLEVALGCARATIDGLREQVVQLEAERDRLRREIEVEEGGGR